VYPSDIAKCKRAMRSTGSCFLQMLDVAMHCLRISVVAYKKQRAAYALSNYGHWTVISCRMLIFGSRLALIRQFLHKTFRLNSMCIQVLSRELPNIMCAHIYTYGDLF